MLERIAKQSGKKFMGCSRYPKCKGMVFTSTYQKQEIKRVERVTNVQGSPEQETIWNSVLDPRHLIITALAGSGKTFSIVEYLYRIFGHNPSAMVLFLAFNVTIVNELLARVPEGIKVKTMNGFGYEIVRSAFPKIRFNEYKLADTLKRIIPQDDKDTEFFMSVVEKLVNLSKYMLLDGKDHTELDLICIQHGIELENTIMRAQIYSYVEQAIYLTGKDTKQVDFTDQLWFVYWHNLPIPRFDYILGDEIQDWNKLQRYVVIRAANTAKFIGVGDENQAIYGFAGADTQSIPNMIEQLAQTAKGVQTLSLTFTRRCPKTHVELAQRIVPNLRAMDTAFDGTVVSYTYDQMVEWSKQIPMRGMIICRRNAPLIKIAYMLIREGRSVIVRGRDIGKGLQSLISRLRADTLEELISHAEQYREKETYKLSLKPRSENAIASLNDKIDTLLALIDGVTTIDALRRTIETLFSNGTESAIILSSVHRAKGLESDTVIILEYDRIQLPMKDPEFAQQEKNLEYIALTRSKRDLILTESQPK